jgi:hypothetical protein
LKDKPLNAAKDDCCDGSSQDCLNRGRYRDNKGLASSPPIGKAGHASIQINQKRHEGTHGSCLIDTFFDR